MKLLRLIATPDYGTNCYLYSPDDAGLWIIDPGTKGLAIIAEIEKLEMSPKGILLTHSHWDHVLGLGVLRKAWPEIPILIHEMERDWLGQEGSRKQKELVKVLDPGFYESYKEAFDSLPSASGTFTDGDSVASGALTVIHTAGHSPGSVCFHGIREGILFSGDTLFQGSIGRSDLPGGNPQELQESLVRLLLLPDETWVLPGHGSPTTIGKERNDNPWIGHPTHVKK
ncbi:MBL fold metallo-hydrolase [Parasphaerochaeta coccoides]|uniref:Beta-lactamase domain protein n=1 Tax=Parasphaerochaeta coccoides (strain ATCC BAA-1237 / DSM 17374 / SPN1) TaxID=760011 RepID=F4GH47_PARC1|nr:MBL fold metallo-hydrolase [Parasphaerochaeta coccoides]AEC01522.1 beta-lactamase domain protein [Parasphaerochaeta coccoides DSM 17374]